jgi:hypothetical protein
VLNLSQREYSTNMLQGQDFLLLSVADQIGSACLVYPLGLSGSCATLNLLQPFMLLRSLSIFTVECHEIESH